MKNYKNILSGLLFFALSLNSYNLYAGVTEVGSTSEMQSVMDNMFSEVNESDITTGILYGSEVTYNVIVGQLV